MEGKKFNLLGIASFVCALIGLLIAAIPCGIAALITGIMALVKFDKEKEKGKWMAITGIALGSADILLGILAVAMVATIL